MERTSKARILYIPEAGATPEAELEVLASVYRFVLFDLRAERGDPHDLTCRSTKEMHDKTRQERKR